MSNIIRNWNSKTIRIREDRYVSLTDMAQAANKLFADWNRQSSTKSYLEALSRSMGIPIDVIIQVKTTGKNEERGTWGHPKIAIRFAQWCNDDFAVWVDCQIDELMTKGSVSLASKPETPAIPFWYQRLTYDQKYTVVPNGYFSIFREVVPLVAELEACGYVLPDDAVPDISVGKLWANYLRSINIIVENIARRYPHRYPDQRGVVHCFCYPESLLPTFRQWFRDTYKTDHLYRYLKSKDKSALPAVTKVVAMLKAST